MLPWIITHIFLVLLFLLARQKNKEAKRKAPPGPIAPRVREQALRCWKKLDWAAWRWISARCILSIGLIASVFFSQ
jgi:hypothetical protein